MRESEPPPGGEAYRDEIVIESDGSVSFKHLSEPLLLLAFELNPEDERLQARMRLVRRDP